MNALFLAHTRTDYVGWLFYDYKIPNYSRLAQ